MVRKRLLAGLTVLLLLFSATNTAPTAEAATVDIELVPAQSETVPVTHAGDAADDPAVWAHPDDPSASLLIGNDKLGALEVYNLDGSLQQRITTDTRGWGNVDLRTGVSVEGRVRDLVAAYNGGLRVYAVNKGTRTLDPVTEGAGVVSTGGGEGLCLYNSARTDELFAFVITLPGRVRQYVIDDVDKDGLLGATLVREFEVGSEAEGCVADDVHGALYISEEDEALWRYGAEPGSGTARTLVDPVQPSGHIAPDSEGVTLIDAGDGAGYIVASAQSTANPTQSYFVVYDRQTNAYVKAFRIVAGSSADGCSRTDGITAYAGDLGPSFPTGAFVCQDDSNTSPGSSGNQDFKLTRLDRVVDLKAVGANLSPEAKFTLSCAELSCTFDARPSSDPDGTVASYSWDFGDGSAGTGLSVSHRYATPGEHVVTLTVRDDDNAFGAVAQTATANAAAEQLTFVAASSANANKIDHTVQIPKTVKAGDLMLAFMTANQDTPTITGPAGWSVERSAKAPGITTQLWSRRATPSDAGSTLTISSSAFVKAGVTVAAYRGVAEGPAAIAAAVKVEKVDTPAHVTPTVTVASTGSWLLSFWSDKSAATAGWTAPSGQRVRSTSVGSGGGRISTLLADSGGPVPSGTRGALTATADSTGSRAGMMTIALRPAASRVGEASRDRGMQR